MELFVSSAYSINVRIWFSMERFLFETFIRELTVGSIRRGLLFFVCVERFMIGCKLFYLHYYIRQVDVFKDKGMMMPLRKLIFIVIYFYLVGREKVNRMLVNSSCWKKQI